MGHFAIFAKIFLPSYFGKGIDLFGEYHQAVQTDVVARQHFEEVTAITVLPVFCLYHSLALLSLLLDASNSQKVALAQLC